VSVEVFHPGTQVNAVSIKLATVQIHLERLADVLYLLLLGTYTVHPSLISIEMASNA
jgi:hypothetical protein